MLKQHLPNFKRFESLVAKFYIDLGSVGYYFVPINNFKSKIIAVILNKVTS